MLPLSGMPAAHDCIIVDKSVDAAERVPPVLVPLAPPHHTEPRLLHHLERHLAGWLMRSGVERTRHRLGERPDGRRPAAVARLQRPGRVSAAAALGWGVAAGFLLGAGFWIYLGVDELAGSGLPQAHGAPVPGCTSLALDRHSGSTSSTPCVGPTPSLRDTLTARLGEDWLR